MTTDLPQRVAAGVAVLDALRPGWWQQIDCETLDLGNDCHCVLGQLWGRFWQGLRVLGNVPERWVSWSTLQSEVRPLLDFARAHGFMAPDEDDGESEEEGDARLVELEGLWTKEIERRRRIDR